MKIFHPCLLACFLLVIFLQLACDIPRDRQRQVQFGKDTGQSKDSGKSMDKDYDYEFANKNFVNKNNDRILARGNLPRYSHLDPNANHPRSNQTIGEDRGSRLQGEFSHCTIFPPLYILRHYFIGDFNICLSKTPKSNRILFQAQKDIYDYRLCFFPTTSSSTSTSADTSDSSDSEEGPRDSSVMIGDAQCIFPVNANTLEQLTFTINRPHFTDRKLTGVMIIKDAPYMEVTPYHSDINYLPTYTTAYQDCMHYLYNTGKKSACQRFKMKGQYIYINFFN